jgi:hypothetical protein
MPKDKPIVDHISRLFKSNYYDIAMFNFVQGIITIRPEFQITKAIELFAKVNKLDETYSIENEKNNYYRMLNKFLDALKTSNDENA